MAYTMQQIVDKGRIPLNDAGKDRITDADLLSYCIDALHILEGRRPDLFFGQYLNMPDLSALVLGSTFPIDNKLAPAVADYITARAETGNDESVVEARATLFFDLFKGQI